MGLPYEVFVDIPSSWMIPMALISFIYTSILGFILLTIASDVIDDGVKLDCQDYLNLWYTNGTNTNGQILFYNDDAANVTASVSQGYLCTDAQNGEEQSQGVDGLVFFGSIGIFICYLLYKAADIKKGASLIAKLKNDGHLFAADTLKYVNICNVFQLFFTELAGVVLITYSKDSVSMLTNSSSVIFLAEVDDIMLELYCTSIIEHLKLKVQLEFGGIEFEAILANEKETKDQTNPVEDDKKIVAEEEEKKTEMINLAPVNKKKDKRKISIKDDTEITEQVNPLRKPPPPPLPEC